MMGWCGNSIEQFRRGWDCDEGGEVGGGGLSGEEIGGFFIRRNLTAENAKGELLFHSHPDFIGMRGGTGMGAVGGSGGGAGGDEFGTWPGLGATFNPETHSLTRVAASPILFSGNFISPILKAASSTKAS